jgi:hypothetical protein
MPEATLAIRNTAPKFLKGASDQTIRNRFWLAYLQKEGRILYNQGGVACNWNVRARQPDTRNHASGVGVIYSQTNSFEQLTVPVAGIIGTQALDLKVQMMNKEPLAIVDLYSDAMESLLAAVGHRLSSELFIRNTGNENQLIGIDTPMVPDGSVSVNDLVALPSSSAAYGGKLVRPGSIGGAWSANLAAADRPSSLLTNDWPLGSGTPDFDYITPKLLNYRSNRWGTGGSTWSDNCEHVMRRGKSWIMNLSGATKTPTLHILSQELYDQFLDRLSVRERLMVSDYGKALGFGDNVLTYGGAMVMPDYDCPAGSGYAVNAAEMSLFSLHSDLFYSVGPDFNNTALATEVLVGFWGNMRFNPKHVAKYGAFGT